jgi:hypothetical protein
MRAINMHTTNYTNTFIAVADDCPVSVAEIPAAKAGKHTNASFQFEMMNRHPYQYDSDDVVFAVYAEKNELTENEKPAARKLFFSKGQPCLRSSPLTKRYGWGVHSNETGKVALYAVESREYQKLLKDQTLKQIKGMRSKKQ